MKIAFFIDNMSMGGAQRVVSVLSSHFAKKGHAVTIVVRQDTFRIAYSLDPSVKVIYFSQKKEELLPTKLSFHGARKFLSAHSDTFAEMNAY